MGLSTTFQCLTVIPLLLFSDRIFRKLSHPNVQVICFAVNVVRLIGMHTSFPHYQRIFHVLIILNFPFKQDIRICTIHICVCYLNRWMRFPGTLRAHHMQPMLTNQERRLLQLPFKDYWEDLPSDLVRIFKNIQVIPNTVVNANHFVCDRCRIRSRQLWRKLTYRSVWPASDFPHSWWNLIHYRPILLPLQFLLFTPKEY